MTAWDLWNRVGMNHEIIIIDEASNDNSCSVLLPPTATVYRNEQRTGVAPARNLGVQKASGTAFLFLDAHMRIKHGILPQMVAASRAMNAIITPTIHALYSTRTPGAPVMAGLIQLGVVRHARNLSVPVRLSPPVGC